MKCFTHNKDLPVGTVVHWVNKINDPVMSGTIHGTYDYDDPFIQYYLVEVVVPTIGATYLDLRTNMNIHLNKEDVPTASKILGDV